MHLAHQNRSRILLTKVQIWTWSGSETGSQLASISIKISAKSTENTLVSIVFSVFSLQVSYFSTFEPGGYVQDVTGSRIEEIAGGWGDPQDLGGGDPQPVNPCEAPKFQVFPPHEGTAIGFL